MRGQPFVHRVTRVLSRDGKGWLLRANELVTDQTGKAVLVACHAYRRVPPASACAAAARLGVASRHLAAFVCGYAMGQEAAATGMTHNS